MNLKKALGPSLLALSFVVIAGIVAACGKAEAELDSKQRNEQSAKLLTSSADGTNSFAKGVSTYCIRGTVWVQIGYNDYSWGGQELDKNGKPIPCE
jgi:hypothetical protein